MGSLPRMGSRRADGLLLIDKPAGVTSHDVVAVARRSTGVRRIGHAGTLDPFATGLLVLLVGRATRLAAYVDGEPKVYDATIVFGASTDTDDVTGEIVREAPAPTRAAVEQSIPALTGRLDQVPPRYSAKQIGGVRAYSAARRGRPLDLPAATVTVHRWELREWRAFEADVRITCSGGTYVRALARDIGELCGSAAHLSALRRVSSGAFTVDDAQPLSAVAETGAVVRPARDAVSHLPPFVVDDDEARRLTHGNPVSTATGVDGLTAVIDATGELIAIADAEGGVVRPKVVLRDG
jgi:tRNA pseudouridine55 synthase